MRGMRNTDVMLLAWVRSATKDGTAQAIRQRADITVAEVAQVCSVTPEAVRYWEKGERTPQGEHALLYARLLDQLRSAAA